MTISPLVSTWFTIGANVPQPEFLAWGQSVEADISALNTFKDTAGNISSAKLADGAVITVKIGDGQVTEAKLGDLSVSTAKLAANAVSNAKLAQIDSERIKGRASASTGAVEDLTPAQVAGFLRPSDGERQLRRAPIFSTDFISSVQTAFPGAGVAGGTLTAAAAAGALVANHPGVLVLSSVATINSGARLQTSVDAFRIAGGEVFDFVFFTPAAFTNVLLRFGFLDTITNADATDGAYFELNGAATIVGKTANNATRSTSATVATLAVSTWYHARISVNVGATQITFEIFDDAGTLVGTQTLSANIPTASGRETGAGLVATINLAAAATLVTADYMSVRIASRTLQRGALT